jgi:ABC-type Fe3+-siderophore transport system permease subunit
MRQASMRAVVGMGAVSAAAVALASLALGVYHVPLANVARALGELFTGGTHPSTDYTLVVDMRLPRALGAFCVGAGLGTAGCMLQSLLRNPLASPFVIGTAQGAGFGAVLAIFLGLPYFGTLTFAFVMSVIAALLVLSLARTQRSLPTESVVLTGLSMSLLFGALIGLMRYLAHDEGILSRMALWILGGLWNVTWGPLAVMAPLVVVSVVAAGVLWRRLDLLALGQEDARRLGLRVGRTGVIVLLLSCVLTSLAVCTGGVVAFVGLIVPHAARRLVGPAHAALVPACAFLGGILVIVADTVARTVAPPQELPLGVVTSLAGVPAFLFIMRSLRVRRTGL